MRQPIALACIAILAGCPGLGIDNETGSTSSDPTTEPPPTTTEPPPTTTFETECTPGQERCADANTREVCKATGLSWEEQPCTKYQTCSEQGDPLVASCLGPCETLEETSIGCEFLAFRMRSFNSVDEEQSEDAVIVGNTDTEKTATVQLYVLPEGFAEEQPAGPPIALGPGESYIYHLESDPIFDATGYKTGGVFHVVSDYPIAAYQHSPLVNTYSNDASTLLPIKALGTDYIVASAPPWVNLSKPDDFNGRPSYFLVIATANDTKVSWYPRTRTAGNGLPIQPVEVGAKGEQIMQRYDVIQVGSSAEAAEGEEPLPFKQQDVSGTVIHANKPIVVMGGSSCSRIPFESTLGGCNHLQEQMLPIKYWGKQYVAPHAPARGDDTKYYWRVYGTTPNQQISTDPSPDGLGLFKINETGQYWDFFVDQDKQHISFVFKSTAPFMPVQYLQSGQELAAKFGDPSMYQTIPVEQHLKRYVFVTGALYDVNYAQVTRKFEGADVFINDTLVDGWYLINATQGVRYEVADFVLPVSTNAEVYVAESDDPFGVNVVGFDTNSAYAYPAGMGLKVINPEGGN